jgi:hypothetical protein
MKSYDDAWSLTQSRCRCFPVPQRRVDGHTGQPKLGHTSSLGESLHKAVEWARNTIILNVRSEVLGGEDDAVLGCDTVWTHVFDTNDWEEHTVSIFSSGKGSSTFPRNFCIYLRVYTVLQSRTTSVTWEGCIPSDLFVKQWLVKNWISS